MKLVIICIIILVLNLFFVQGVVMFNEEGFVVVEESNNKEMWSEKGLCDFVKGCFVDDECYPRGYRKEGQSCSKKVHPFPHSNISAFINQSKAGESCEDGFECVSNFCFNEKCVNQISSLITNIIQRISIVESKFNILQLNLGELKNLTQEQNITINQTEKSQKGGIIGFIIKMFD